MTEHSSSTREDVLNAFAMDFEPGAGILERYLLQYPEYSLQLVDLSRELSREFDDDEPLSVNELAAISAGMRRLQECPATLQALQDAPAKTFTSVAKALGWPIQAGLALREHRIEASTIPARVHEKLAKALQVSAAVLDSFLALPPQTSQLRASKSSTKPVAAAKVSLERTLRDAGVDEEILSKFLNNE